LRFIGIDLGSTTTKAVVIDEDRNVPDAASPTALELRHRGRNRQAGSAGQHALPSVPQCAVATGALKGKLDDFLGHLSATFA
jgi:activator of 2-hydroxyglutaryl-CoA dehydratase